MPTTPPRPALRLLLAALACLLLAPAGCRQRDESAMGPAQPMARYEVQAGDSLIALSARFDIPVRTIISTNHLLNGELVVGETLLLPGVEPDQVQAAPAPSAPGPDEGEGAAVATDAGGWYVPRSAWAVAPIDMSDILPMTHIFRLTVHHSGDEGDVEGDTVTLLRHFEHIHQAVHHWACIGYHFIIGIDGTVYEGRPLRFQGAHAVGDNNIGNIGICLIGDFDRQLVPPAQRRSLIAVLDRLTQEYGIRKSQIFGHEEFKNTACPGRHLMKIVADYRGIPPHPVAGG